MTQFTKNIALIAMAALTLTSCNEEAEWSDSADRGGVRLNLTSDCRVMRQTRADDSVSPVVPDGNAFSISLSKSDGTYSKSWNGVESFNREKSFPIGDYDITATYGNLDIEGFDNPYYKGRSDLHVSPGAVSDVSITAALANAMVSVRYTDAFVAVYPGHSAAVQTDGHDWVVFAPNEDRPAYIAPCEDVKLNLTLTNSGGEQVTIQPAGFQALARHHYVVTIGVTGNTAQGNLALDIAFDEDVVSETVNVPLGEELFSAPAPSITASEFKPEMEVGNFEYTEMSARPEFHVFAFGGLKSTRLNIVSETGYVPAFGRTVELVNADNMTQQQLTQEGVICNGFFRNVEKLGVINVKGLLERLPAGKYTIEVQAVDALTRTSEPLKLSAEVKPIYITLTPVANVGFMPSEVSVDVTTNYPAIIEKLSFKVPDANNRMVDAQVKNLTPLNPESSDKITYRYALGLQPAAHSTINVEMTMALAANKSRTLDTHIDVAAPEYALASDAFSNKVVVKLDADDPALVKALINNMQIYNGDTQVPTANVDYDSENGFISISGLTPGVKYVSLKTVCGAFSKAIPEFTTEQAADVPNGSFNAATQTINIAGINAGGMYKCSTVYTSSRYNTSSIVVSEPNGWQSINAKTCYSNGSVKNTWFMVPSTFMNNGAVVIRSVAYDHNGTLPEVDNRGIASGKNYFSTKAPSSFAYKSSGELFLGSYSFTSAGESRSEGVAFSSRPASLEFEYMYAPYGSESASAEITVILDNDEEVTKKQLLTKSTSLVKTSLPLPSYPFGRKAKGLKVKFKSTDGSEIGVTIPSGATALNDIGDNTTTAPVTIAANAYKSLATGSVLTVDNVKLNYQNQIVNRGKRGRK